METLEKTIEVRNQPVKTVIDAGIAPMQKKRAAFGWLAQQNGFENARFGWMAILLTFQSCVGAIACMLIQLGGGNVIALSLCAAVTMGSNAMFIALASSRVCLTAFYLSLALNTAFILLYLP